MSTLRISDAPLLPDVDGTEKIPTGGRGDYAISVDQIKDHIFQDVGKELVGLGNVDNTSDLDKPVSTAQQAALNLKADKTYVDTNLDLKADKTNVYTRSETTLALSQKADLVGGVIPSNQLPSYVDDVVEYTTNTLPTIGESGKIYVTTDTNRTWRWSGNQYVEISNGGVSDSTLKLQTPRKIANIDFDGTQNIDIPHNNLINRNIANAHAAEAISTATGEDQQTINDYNGAKWRNKVGGYDLSARVTLDNGDVVKSTVANNTVNPNTDMTGWVNHEADQNKIINKTSLLEPLDETVDATPFLQSLFDAMPDGMTLDLLGKTFRVKKNTGFASDYPNGDQPCLVVKANNITITNGKLIVKEHGQGILDSFGENLNLVGVTLQGAGNFPLLDGNTGRGEKGFTNGGYYNEALHNSGMPKNNSVDTSSLSTGGYGGNFPQWGGGTASTWGTWNGGFIFNEGSGLTVKGGSAVVKYCDISGFNGYGCLSDGGSLEVKHSEIHHIYTAGVHGKVIAGKVVDFLDVQNNNIHHIGHPDALNTNLYADPGYGVSTGNGGATDSGIRKYIVEHNDITFCRRKGIDAHHGYDISIQNNLIEDCGTGVNITIYALGKNPSKTIINGNTVRRIHHSLKDATMGIFVECNANLSRFTGSAFVTNNKVEGVGLLKSVYDVYKAEWTATAAGIVVCGVHDATVTGNTVDSTADYICKIGIADGLNTALNTPVIDISHNTIRGAYEYGIFSIAGTNTTSNATIPNRGSIIGNKLDVTRRIDATGNTYNIYSSPLIKVSNNSLVERPATMQNYYQPNMEGQSVAIRVDVSAGTASLVDRSNLVSPYYTPTITKVSGQLRISLPANSTLRFASIAEATNLRTATHTPIFHATGSSSPNQYLSLSFYRASGDTVVSVSVNDIVGGVLDIKLDLM